MMGKNKAFLHCYLLSYLAQTVQHTACLTMQDSSQTFNTLICSHLSYMHVERICKKYMYV